MDAVQREVMWWADLGWLLGGDPHVLSVPFPLQDRGEKKMEKLVGRDKDREIPHQLPSWPKQSRLGENLFSSPLAPGQRLALSRPGFPRGACPWLRGWAGPCAGATGASGNRLGPARGSPGRPCRHPHQHLGTCTLMWSSFCHTQCYRLGHIKISQIPFKTIQRVSPWSLIFHEV